MGPAHSVTPCVHTCVCVCVCVSNRPTELAFWRAGRKHSTYTAFHSTNFTVTISNHFYSVAWNTNNVKFKIYCSFHKLLPFHASIWPYLFIFAHHDFFPQSILKLILSSRCFYRSMWRTFLQHPIEGRMEGEREERGKRGRRRKQLLDNLKRNRKDTGNWNRKH